MKNYVNRREVESCLIELKVHGLVKEGPEKDTYVITEKTLCLVQATMDEMAKTNVGINEHDLKMRSLIFVVLQEMGNVSEKYVPVYVGILNGFIH